MLLLACFYFSILVIKPKILCMLGKHFSAELHTTQPQLEYNYCTRKFTLVLKSRPMFDLFSKFYNQCHYPISEHFYHFKENLHTCEQPLDTAFVHRNPAVPVPPVEEPSLFPLNCHWYLIKYRLIINMKVYCEPLRSVH